MANTENDDLITRVIGVALASAAGYVGYKVVKAIANRGQDALPSTQPAPAIATTRSRYESLVSQGDLEDASSADDD